MRFPNRLVAVTGAAALAVGVLSVSSLEAGHRRGHRHARVGHYCCPPVYQTCCGGTAYGYGYGAPGYQAATNYGYGHSYATQGYSGNWAEAPPSTAAADQPTGPQYAPSPYAEGQFHDQPRDVAQGEQFQQRAMRPDFEGIDREQQMQQRIDELEQENEQLRQELNQLQGETTGQEAVDQAQPPERPSPPDQPEQPTTPDQGQQQEAPEQPQQVNPANQ